MLVLRYFQCEPKYGLFAPAHKIKKIASAPAASGAPSESQSDSSAAPAVAEEKTSRSAVIVSRNMKYFNFVIFVTISFYKLWSIISSRLLCPQFLRLYFQHGCWNSWLLE